MSILTTNRRYVRLVWRRFDLQIEGACGGGGKGGGGGGVRRGGGRGPQQQAGRAGRQQHAHAVRHRVLADGVARHAREVVCHGGVQYCNVHFPPDIV